MKKINNFFNYLMAFSFSFLILFSHGVELTPDNLDGVKKVTAQEAKKLQDAGAMMIDTRIALEHATKTIKGSKSVIYKEKSAKVAKFDKSVDSFDLSQLPADKTKAIVIFCQGAECWKSYKASVFARDAGYTNVYWLRGGLPEWAEAGLPTQ